MNGAAIVLATCRDRREPTPSDRLLAAALRGLGAEVRATPWDEIEPATETALVCLRSTWDYHLRPAEFRRWLAGWDASPGALVNAPPLVRWNLDKIYLRDLAAAGVRVPRTAWGAAGEVPRPEAFMAAHGLSTCVVKPRIGATAYGLERLERGAELGSRAAAELARHGFLLQEFLPEVEDLGELSLVFVGGELSHAVRKVPADGDYRVQAELGGAVVPHSPTAAQRRFAEEVLRAAPAATVYARVDLVDAAAGPTLMELELI